MKRSPVAIPVVETRAIVSCSQGSWRYQNAYRVAVYRAAWARDGRYLWKLHDHVTGKSSMPQLVARGYGHLPVGGRHNRPLTEAETALLDDGGGCDPRRKSLTCGCLTARDEPARVYHKARTRGEWAYCLRHGEVRMISLEKG